MLFSIVFLPIFLLALVSCSDNGSSIDLGDDPNCIDVQKPLEFNRMYTVVIGSIKDQNLKKLFAQVGTNSKQLIRAANKHLEGTDGSRFMTASAILSPLVFHLADIEGFVIKNFPTPYKNILKRYLLFTKYKFYCKLSHKKKKRIFESEGLWEDYKSWKHWYKQLYKSFLEAHDKKKPELTKEYEVAAKFVKSLL